MPSGRRGHIFGAADGFTLPAMLVLIAGIGCTAVGADLTSRYRMAREREAELMFRGLAYVRAIRSFYLAEKEPLKRRLPRDLEELENDPRSAYRRHIRKLYKDPLTGSEFRVLKDGTGGVTGVASSSTARVFRRTKISDDMPFAGGVERYDQLLFEIDPKILEARAPRK
jgi:type II secretory pathway pseudopilin PulG